MADKLGTQGKVVAMTGIKNAITGIQLKTSDLDGLSITNVTGTSFSVDINGILSNTVAIEFTLDSYDLNKTASIVALTDDTGLLVELNLDTPVFISTAGTATLAISAISVNPISE